MNYLPPSTLALLDLPTPPAIVSPAPPAPPLTPPRVILTITVTGAYNDCTGTSPLPPGVWHDTCFTSTVLLASHRWSTGARFFALRAGSLVGFRGRLYTVYAIVHRPARATDVGSAPLTLQTCWTVDASVNLIIQAR